MSSTPAHTIRLSWDGDLRFSGVADDQPVALDGDNEAAASPVQMLATGLAGCMAIDVVHILSRMRTPASAIDVELTIDRAESDPRRVTVAAMHFHITGDVPAKNVERALAMSRETYCSVWHSLRQDIDFETSFEIEAG